MKKVKFQKTPHPIRHAKMYKSNDRRSLITFQIVQNALLNNEGIRSDEVVVCLLKPDKYEHLQSSFAPI